MKNVVLCFDQLGPDADSEGGTNATRVFESLEQSDDQVAWYRRSSLARVRRATARVDACEAIDDAYDFLRETWEPGDRIFVFGVGPGGYCAQALTHLIGTAGVLPRCWSDLVDHVVMAYAIPRTRRTHREWQVVREVIAELSDESGQATVDYLGLWDALRDVRLPKPTDEPLDVERGRHAIAADGGPVGQQLVPATGEHVEQAWFRGVHRDVAGGPGACAPLAGIAMDWVLDGAASAGVRLRSGIPPAAPGPSDALAGSAPALPMLSQRKVPDDAVVHASVDLYVRAHPEYRRRLPDHVAWTDDDWPARGERLAVVEAVRAPDLVPVTS